MTSSLSRVSGYYASLGGTVTLSGLLALTYVLYVVLAWALRKRLPPGPAGLPWIGNKYQMPAVKPWRKLAEWNAQFGPVVSLFLGGTPVIILGTAQAAWDLLEKRSDIYSSRPRFVVAGEILSDNKRGLMMPAGERWRKFRKVLHGGLHLRKADSYKEIQSLESKILMHQLLHEPTAYERHVKRFSASVVVSVAYGRRIESIDEWIVKENEASMACIIPGKYLVESWPWLLKLPRSLQWFRREPEERRQRDIKLLTSLLDDVKKRTAEGTCPPCLASEAYAAREKLGMSELQIAYTVSSPFGAGIDTTAGATFIFLLGMLHFPKIMRKAQAELDSVIGRERMPEFDDRERLPYICAVISETLRWRSVTPLGGTPHAVTEEDEYHGMRIPKGSTVFANFYGIMQDPVMFPDPDSFLPERFIDTTNPRLKDFDLPFGFGRRICPGMHLASNSLFINISRLLWGFDLLPDGPLPDTGAFTNGFNSWPLSFKCRFQPRDGRVTECIEREYEAANEALGKWK
ncbi:cytochrome P450 [Artomyces pyxidatus]|uniref:Cytochrome P450 n=1 Tax=Artomyces pyxidatus TaxID=48021 RepID=A0ACB8SMK0_9AGAM|nr:cytochrome P450 [Artomyces pyxidatus]